MNYKKLVGVLMTGLLLGMAGQAVSAEDNILYAARNFAYSTLDAHDGDESWMIQGYGVVESLFKMGDDMTVQPWLAESAELDGNVWTIKLKDGVTFSNGNPMTADIVIKNLQRSAEKNAGKAILGEFTYNVVDDLTFTVESETPYPTLPNLLAQPGNGIIDVDSIQDFDTETIGTGPFVIEDFVPTGDVTVTKNENYWGGDVKLDGAVIYYMPDADSELMAMQNGELDCYDSVTSDAIEIFEQDPDTYDLVTIPATRVQFYLLNENRLDANMRDAINYVVDSDEIAGFLGGAVTPTAGPFNEVAAYGKAEKQGVDTEKAKSLIEEAGYTLNADGMYEKDGEPLSLKICYYDARMLGDIAVVMQDELSKIGVASELVCEEDPDATYMNTGDFDIALYCCVADMGGDPEYFLDSVVSDGAFYGIGGFEDEECKTLLAQLKQEADPEVRAELGNQMVQKIIDDDAMGFVALFNKTTVLRKGVSGFAETSPFDFYGIDANTEKVTE